jgi:predicted membrane-bound spermidine synthase
LPAPEARRVVLAGLLFLLSGASALVYQVAWQRILALHSGVGLYSVAMIVAAFMAGLGIGSHLGGRLSARTGPRTALWLFALVELAIGLFGAASPFLYYDWLYPLASRLPSPSLRGGLAHLAALLPPTLLMGMSLPLLVRAMLRDVATAGSTIGYLYGINMLGAAAGAFAAPWLLLPSFGVPGAVTVAAVLNGLAGLGALLLATSSLPAGVAAGATPAADDGGALPSGPAHPFALWLSLYALSGFVALSLEILWFRLLDVAVKSTAFTFGTVLGIYLTGSAAGCLLAVPRVSRLRQPLATFLLCQCAILLLAGLSVTALVRLPPTTPVYRWFVEYWGSYRFFRFGHVSDPQTVLHLYALLPIVLFALPTVLMGFAFPVLQRAVHDELRTSGRKVGALQAANIAGCVAGSLLVGLAALQWLGAAEALRLVTLVGLVFAAVGWRYHGRRFGLAAVALVGLALALPGREELWRRLHGEVNPDGRILFEEDATGVVALGARSEVRLRLFVNGKGNSWLPFGGVHTVLGALPAVVHPAPRRVAVVGLGSGDTAWAAGCRRETQSVTVFEISSPQPRILRRAVTQQNLPELASFLSDPRVTIRLEDGRRALEALRGEGFDAIETDAIWPESAGSGNLYSLEFFETCARRLRAGGLMCTWAPTPRVRATFRTVFPHVLDVDSGVILIGSRYPIQIDVPAWEARLQQSAAYLGELRAQAVLDRLHTLLPAAGPIEGLPNRDLFPRDEFAR